MLSLSSCGSSSFVVWTNFGRGFRLRSGDRVWASRESFLRSAGGGGGGGSGCCDFFNFMEEVLEEVEAAVIVVVVVATGIGGVGFSFLASRGMIRRGATLRNHPRAPVLASSPALICWMRWRSFLLTLRVLL